MRFIGFFVLLFSCSVATGQFQSNRFKISFSTYNHAERIFNGTTTYTLTESSIKVTKVYFGDTASKTVYSKKIKKTLQILSELNRIELDSISDYYFNYCVMPTSGNEYFIEMLKNKSKKSISLHHYYLKQLDDIIKIINSTLPRKYQFRYLKKDEKQDCRL